MTHLPQYDYREGSLAEALAAKARVPELDRPLGEADMQARLAGKKTLVQVAVCERECVGFKIGYQVTNTEFYSWLGGVSSSHRGRGIAARLMAQQEKWAIAQGYEAIRVKSTNRYPGMLQLLIRRGYQICGYEDRSDLRRNKIHFIKYLPEE